MAKKKLSPTTGPGRQRTARRPQRQSERLPALTDMARKFAALHDPAAEVAPLAPDEIGFLYIYAACGDKRLALELAYGLDANTLTATEIYRRAQPILIRADLSGDWKAALRRHELTHDDLAAHLTRLLTCGNPHAEVSALKLALMTGGLIERGDHAAAQAGPGATFHFHMQGPAPPHEPRNVTPPSAPPGVRHAAAQPFLIEPEE